MRPAFFSLILIAVHASVPVDCRPRPWDPEGLPRNQERNLHTRVQADMSARVRHSDLELRRSMRKGIHRHFLVILPTRTDRSSFVSIFDLRRKRFLCVGLKGELFTSSQRDRQDCLFQHIWLDVFYSVSTGRLLRLDGAELPDAQQEPPEPSLEQVQMFLGPLVKRQRRSEAVNPADPLRSESHPAHAAKDHRDGDHGQPEQDRAGAVSKETITSCDDPLRVLQPNGPGSPVKTNIADRAQQD